MLRLLRLSTSKWLQIRLYSRTGLGKQRAAWMWNIAALLLVAVLMSPSWSERWTCVSDRYRIEIGSGAKHESRQPKYKHCTVSCTTYIKGRELRSKCLFGGLLCCLSPFSPNLINKYDTTDLVYGSCVLLCLEVKLYCWYLNRPFWDFLSCFWFLLYFIRLSAMLWLDAKDLMRVNLLIAVWGKTFHHEEWSALWGPQKTGASEGATGEPRVHGGSQELPKQHGCNWEGR